MRHILANDGIYFALVLVAGAVDFVSDNYNVEEEYSRQLRFWGSPVLLVSISS
jgi:hypothetical protein